MFEKEAEEIANKRCHEIMCFGHCSFSSPKHHRCGEWHREYNCAKEGIEYGYNKANEWHYVKDGDLPNEDIYLVIRLNDENTCYKYCTGFWEKEEKCFHTLFCSKVNIKDIIAWKEIVLPKESE